MATPQDGTHPQFPVVAGMEVDPATIEDNPAARQAIETIRNDLFNFSADSLPVPTSELTTEEQAAVDEVSFQACALIEHYLNKPGVGKQKRRMWEKERQVTLPVAEIKDKLFRLTARRDTKTGTTHIDFARAEEDMPPNDFTVIRSADGSSRFILTPDRPEGMPEVSHEEQMKAIKQAGKWIRKYSEEIHVNKQRLDHLPHGSVLPEEIPELLHGRRRKIGIGVLAGAISLAAIGGIGVATNTVFQWRNRTITEWDESHFLPETAHVVKIGEWQPVGYGGTLDQEIIDNADISYGDPREYHIEDAGAHFIRAMQKMELSPKGKDDSCETIIVEGLSGQASVRAVALSKPLSDSLVINLERAHINICNTNPDASFDIGERELFIEITDPEE